MDRAKFYSSIKGKLYGGKLAQNQVGGMDAIFDAWEASRQVDPRWLAYMLATAHHETGGKFIASVESLNYSVDGLLKTFGRHRISEADARRLGRTTGRPADQQGIANVIYGGKWGANNLGNTQAGDGWAYRGRGLVQITGRANYAKYGLSASPDAASEIKTAAHIMVDGMIYGRFTGKKLASYFSSGKADPVNARQIINAMDKAETIAAYYGHFLRALDDADG